MRKYAESISVFKRYKWYLRSLNAKDAERRRILAHIRDGLISRDTLDPDWQTTMLEEIESLKEKMAEIESIIEGIPDRTELLPCKLFLRLHFVIGLSMTETAEKLNVSETTLRRIRDLTIRYFNENPPQI